MRSLYDELKHTKNIDHDFGNIVARRTIEKRFLMAVTLEITPLCNFSCSFCYIRIPKKEFDECGHKLLMFDSWKKLIDEFTELGAVNCTITGGECTLHPDFCRIYAYAYDKGMDISVMTNASNITDEIFELFKSKPPFKIYATMYGFSEKVYEQQCGSASFFSKVKQNLEKLAQEKFPLILQYTAGKENIEDFEAVYEYSKQLDLEFRYGDLLVKQNRCDEHIIAEHSADHSDFTKVNKRIYCERNGLDYKTVGELPDFYPPLDNEIIEKGVPCNAGRNHCQINWRGEMRACNAFDDAFVEYPLEKSAAECWKNVIAWSDGVPRLTECTNCLFKTKCKTCIAAHYNDVGEFGKPSPRLCWKITNPDEAQAMRERYEAFLKKQESLKKNDE